MWLHSHAGFIGRGMESNFSFSLILRLWRLWHAIVADTVIESSFSALLG
jgi:hypothetical protein